MSTATGHGEGGLWHDLQVKRMLRDTSPKGIYYFNRITGDKKVQKPESEWGKVECEAIVTSELWDQVNQIGEEQGKKYKRRGPMPTQYSGISFGAIAGARCITPRHTGPV
jgi:hypothetical protein